MSLFEDVNAGIKAAMKARDKQRLEALKGIKAEFLLIKTAPENNGEVTDANAIKALVRMVKQRKESAELYAARAVRTWPARSWHRPAWSRSSCPSN